MRPPGQAVGAGLTILEGQELKDAVHDGHHDGERQQVGVGLQEGHLEEAAMSREPGSLLPPRALRQAGRAAWEKQEGRARAMGWARNRNQACEGWGAELDAGATQGA